jgi:hypothetical protein
MSITPLAPTMSLALGIVRSAELKAQLASSLSDHGTNSAMARLAREQAEAEGRVARVLLKLEELSRSRIDFFT